jgi:hypothetical protein
MTDLSNYDWSQLDRKTLTSIIGKAKNNIVETPIRGLKFTKLIRGQIRNAGIPINIKTCFDPNTQLNQIQVGGLYEGAKDKKNQKAITITLYYHAKKELININYVKWRKLCYEIADTVLHEVIHARQYRRRRFKHIEGYESMAESAKQRNKQEYLGHADEIDAYAFNIACHLKDMFRSNQKSKIDYLNKTFDGRAKQNLYTMYLYAFDFDHNHEVIKKLKKKIIHYMPYAELGKPYKTNDWLKK